MPGAVCARRRAIHSDALDRAAGTSIDARSYSHDVTIICHIRSYFAIPFALSSAFWALSICLAFPTA